MSHPDWTVNVDDPLGPLVPTAEKKQKLDYKNQFNGIAKEVDFGVREVDIPNYVGDIKKFKEQNPDKTIPSTTVKLYWQARTEPKLNEATGFDEWERRDGKKDHYSVLLREAEWNGLNPQLAKANEPLRQENKDIDKGFQAKLIVAHDALRPSVLGREKYYTDMISDIEQARDGKFSYNMNKDAPQATTTYQNKSGLRFADSQKKTVLNYGNGDKKKEQDWSMDR